MRHHSYHELPERLPCKPLNAMSREEFYRRHPDAPSMEPGTPHRWLRRPVWSLAALGLATAAALMLLVWPEGTHDPGPPPPFGTRQAISVKGPVLPPPAHAHAARPGLFVELDRDLPTRELETGSFVTSDDLLRLYYRSTEHDYLFLFSLDERGSMSLYYPQDEGQSIPIFRGDRIPLQDRIALDDGPGQELFVALFTTAPVSHQEVQQAVDRAIRSVSGTPLPLGQLPTLGLPGQEVRFSLVVE
jgi:hypothetical protein